ncbi:NAD(P)-binding protein [Zopfia rhizophila CBS 207.26]|uniref:NAD(P)-binding protein n=1 Tax=Zopfia rhizophila CBS 207.26 TaxID=1314779 RepID=A0A6A6DQY8_9PEZI|nr:NAD(P)-binding protein [Zopfia rhizophila CBS 207.26]
MTGSKVLVLGGTGPAGICLLRELAYRNHATVVYARNPYKIPKDLVSNPLIEVIKGEMDDLVALSTAVDQSSTVISLLGPNINDGKINPTLFADCYKSSVFPLMRRHGVRRIIAMGTISIVRPEDRWTFFQSMVVLFEAQGLDWTVFRIASIPGKSDEASWRKDREDGEVFVGWVGEKGWTGVQKRGALTRWLVDAAEGGAEEWVGKMPAVSRLAGSKNKS